MTLDLTKPHKRVEFTIKISANRQSTINGGEEFFTMDSGGTAVGVFNFELEDENGGFKKLNLTGIKNILIGFDFTVVDSKVVLEPEILDAENGRVALVLPNQFEYSGPVLGYTYIIWKDGREQDGGEFQLTFTESWLDKELPEMEDFYVRRFEDLAEEIRRRVQEIKSEMDKELKTVKQDITTAQIDINRIQQQIDENDIVRQDEFNNLAAVGRNVLRNGRTPTLRDNNSATNQSRIEVMTEGSITFIRCTMIGGTSATNITTYTTFPLSQIIEDLAGKTVELTHKIRANKEHRTGTIMVVLYGGVELVRLPGDGSRPIANLSTDWQTIRHVVTIPKTYNEHTGLRFNSRGADNVEIGDWVDFRDWSISIVDDKWSLPIEDLTAEQVGALPINGGTLTGDLTRGNVRIGSNGIGTHNAVDFRLHSGTGRTSLRLGQGNIDINTNNRVRILREGNMNQFMPLQASRVIADTLEGTIMTNHTEFTTGDRSCIRMSNPHSDRLRYVYGLVKIDAVTGNTRNHAIGRFIVRRNNGNNVQGYIDLSIQQRHNNMRPDVTMLQVGLEQNFRICTFTRNGQKWAGLELHLESHFERDFIFQGVITAEPFVTAYKRSDNAENAGEVLNAEINNSINFTDFNLQDRFVFNGTSVSLNGHTHSANDISSGTLNIDRLPNVRDNNVSIGPTANTSLTFGGTFPATQFTADTKGRVTLMSTRTMTMPTLPTATQINAMQALGRTNGDSHAAHFRLNGVVGVGSTESNPGFPSAWGAVLTINAADRGGQIFVANGGAATTGGLWFRSGNLRDGQSGAWINMRSADWINSGTFSPSRIATTRHNWIFHTNAASATVGPGSMTGNGLVVGAGGTGDSVAITLARNSTGNVWSRFLNNTGNLHIQRKTGDATTWTNMLSFDSSSNATFNGNAAFNGNITAPRFIGNTDTATRLQTPRLINGVAFDGSTNINIQAQTAVFDIKDWNNLNAELIRYVPARDVVRVVSITGSLNGPGGHVYCQGQYTSLDNANGFLEVIAHANSHIFPIAKYYRRFGGGQWGEWFTDSHEKPVWINLTPINGTTSHSSASTPQYCKIGHTVYLRGAFTNILGPGTTCATLPVGFRPVGQNHSFVQNTTVGNNITYFARWSITQDGRIELWRINRTDGYVPGNWFPIHTSFVVG